MGESVVRKKILNQSEPLREMPYAMYLPECEKDVHLSATVPSVLKTFVSKNNSPTGSLPFGGVRCASSICARVARKIWL